MSNEVNNISTPPSDPPKKRRSCLKGCLGAFGVLIALVAVGVGISRIVGSVKAKQQAPAQTRSDLEALGKALKMYQDDYDGVMPIYTDASTFENALSSYVPNTTDRHDPFIDSANQKPFLPDPAYSGKVLKNVGDPASIAVISEQPPFSGSQLKLFGDGHVAGGEN